MASITVTQVDKNTGQDHQRFSSLDTGISSSMSNQDSVTSNQGSSSHQSTPSESESEGSNVLFTTKNISETKARSKEVGKSNPQISKKKQACDKKKLEDECVNEKEKRLWDEKRRVEQEVKFLKQQQKEVKNLNEIEKRKEQVAQQKKAEQLHKKAEKRFKEEKKVRQEKDLKRLQDRMKCFIVVTQAPVLPDLPGSDVGSALFKPYQIQKDVFIANLQRVKALSPDRVAAMDSIISGATKACFEDKKNLYLGQLKSGSHRPRKFPPTFPRKEAGIHLVGHGKLKPKMLQFNENVRPAYYGTMRLKSRIIRPRYPFAEDTSILDYGLDSDEEWAADQDAESAASDGSEELDEEMDEDDQAFIEADEIAECKDCEVELSVDTAYEKKKVTSAVERWMNQKKVSRLVKQIIGPFWQEQEIDCPILLKSLAAIHLYNLGDEDSWPVVLAYESLGQFVSKIPQPFMLYLIKTVHGSNESRGRIAKTLFSLIQNRQDIEVISKFVAYDQQLTAVLGLLEPGEWSSEENLKNAISEIADRKKPRNNGKAENQKTCWFVKETTRDLFSVLEGDSLPNPSCLVKELTTVDPISVVDTSDGQPVKPAKKKLRLTDDLLSTPKLVKSTKNITTVAKPKKNNKLTASRSKQTTLDSFVTKKHRDSLADGENSGIAKESLREMNVDLI